MLWPRHFSCLAHGTARRATSTMSPGSRISRTIGQRICRYVSLGARDAGQVESGILPHRRLLGQQGLTHRPKRADSSSCHGELQKSSLREAVLWAEVVLQEARDVAARTVSAPGTSASSVVHCFEYLPRKYHLALPSFK